MPMAKAKASQAARVAVTTTTVRGGGARRQRRRRQRRPTAPTTTTTKKVVLSSVRPRQRQRLRRVRRTRGEGRVITQTVTATLGTVGSNQGNNVEMELSMLMNPALAKETTGSNQFGPIQMCAATYSQWRLKWAHLRLTPLVGQSAVSGTVVRCSLNMTGNPSSSSWSALGARKHVDATPGKSAVLKLTHMDFPGPKEGWYNTNPKGDPNMSIGGSIEVHSLGKTMSTYQATQFAGDLFLVEMTATWLFRNYNPQPGLLNLVKGSSDTTTPQNITITGTTGEPITMTVPTSSRFGRASGSAAASEIIWQVADTTISLVTSAFPPPFSWLFKGGWWFIKRVSGAPVRAGEEVFRVYSSIQDARADVPCIATGDVITTINSTGWDYTQVTPGNTGIGDVVSYARSTTQIPEPDPTLTFTLNGFLQKMPLGSGQEALVPYAPSFTMQKAADTGIGPGVWWPRWGIGITSDSVSNQLRNGYTTTTIIAVTNATFVQSNGWAGSSLDGIIPNVRRFGAYEFKTEGGENICTPIGYVYAYAQWVKGDYKSTMLLMRAEQTKTVQLLPGGATAPVPCDAWTYSRAITQSGSTPWCGTRFYNLEFNFSAQNINIVAGRDYILHFGANGSTRDDFYLGSLTVKRPTGALVTPTSNPWITGEEEGVQAGALPSVGQGIVFTFFGHLRTAIPPVVGTYETPTVADPAQALSSLRLSPTPSEEDWLDTMLQAHEDMMEDQPYDVHDECPTPEEIYDEDLFEDAEELNYSEPPLLFLRKLTEQGRALFERVKGDMKERKALHVAQMAYPSRAYKCWCDTYHDALVDGSSPPEARGEAWKRTLAIHESRGHAE